MSWRIPQYRKLKGGYISDVPDLSYPITFYEIDFRRYYNAALDVFEFQYKPFPDGEWEKYFSVTSEQWERAKSLLNRGLSYHSFLFLTTMEASNALAERSFYKVERVNKES